MRQKATIAHPGRRRRMLAAVAAPLAVALAVSACGGGDTNNQGGEKPTTFVYAVSALPQGLDADIATPGMQAAVVQLYEPLLGYATTEPNASGARSVDPSKLEGRLVESWETSADGLTYTLHLRQGVKSALGNEFTSADVLWSWDKSREQKRTGNFLLNAANVASYSAPDAYTVEVTLNQPSPIFLQILTSYAPAIYDSTETKKHATDADPFATEWIARNAAGFGAYQIDTANTTDQRIQLTANPNYYRGQPQFQTVILVAAPETSIRAGLVSSGSAQFAHDLTYEDAATAAANGAKVQEIQSNMQQRALMNPNIPPFDNVDVRRAFNYAMPHQQIIDEVFDGKGIQAKSTVSSVIPGYDGSFWNYERDIDKAKDLLAQAGYPNGLEVTLTYASQSWSDEKFALQLQAGLKEAGITVNLNKVTGADLLAETAVGKRTVPFFVIYDQSVVLDAGYALNLSVLPTGAADRNDYNNPELTELVKQANATLDPAERNELLRQAQKIAVEDAPWMFGVEVVAQAVMGSNIEGWVWYPDNYPRIADFYTS